MKEKRLIGTEAANYKVFRYSYMQVVQRLFISICLLNKVFL